MPKTSLHAFKAKDTQFVADWLKSKGLHKLCSVFEGIQEPFIFIYLWHVRVLSIKPCLHTQKKKEEEENFIYPRNPFTTKWYSKEPCLIQHTN